MPEFYERMAATATRLINARGRTVQVRKLSRTKADASKPHRGDTDSRTTPVFEVDRKMVFVDPVSFREMGLKQLLDTEPARFSQIGLVTGEGAEALETSDEVLDGGKVWRIRQAHRLKPGDTILLYVFEVAA